MMKISKMLSVLKAQEDFNSWGNKNTNTAGGLITDKIISCLGMLLMTEFKS